MILTFTPGNSQSVIYCKFLRGGFRRRCTILCFQCMPPTREAIGRGQRRQSAKKAPAPAKKSRKQPVNLLAPNVDSLDNQDAMDTLV